MMAGLNGERIKVFGESDLVSGLADCPDCNNCNIFCSDDLLGGRTKHKCVEIDVENEINKIFLIDRGDFL